MGCHQWGLSLPEPLANRLHPKIVAFGCPFTAGFCLTVSVVKGCKIIHPQDFVFDPCIIEFHRLIAAIYSKRRRRYGFVLLTGHLPVFSLNLTFRNLVILQRDKCDFLLEAASLQTRPNVEGCERVTRNEAVLLS